MRETEKKTATWLNSSSFFSLISSFEHQIKINEICFSTLYQTQTKQLNARFLNWLAKRNFCANFHFFRIKIKIATKHQIRLRLIENNMWNPPNNTLFIEKFSHTHQISWKLFCTHRFDWISVFFWKSFFCGFCQNGFCFRSEHSAKLSPKQKDLIWI